MIIEGQKIELGDTVCFKSDVEQCGRVQKIKPPYLIIEAFDDEGFDGHYIKGQSTVVMNKRDCWVE